MISVFEDYGVPWGPRGKQGQSEEPSPSCRSGLNQVWGGVHAVVRERPDVELFHSFLPGAGQTLYVRRSRADMKKSCSFN